jgi:hypothetical protein
MAGSLCITGILRVYYIHVSASRCVKNLRHSANCKKKLFYRTYDVTWFCEPVWAWTAVEAHVAIICASAPALKVFFKQYLNVTALSSSLQNSWRQREYHRKGYTADKSFTGFGTNSSAAKSGKSGSRSTETDIELGGMKGGIEVTQEVDIDTESRPETAETFLESDHSSREGLQGSHVRQLSKADAPWLNISPPLSHGP